MLRIHHTAWPASREHEAKKQEANTVKDGGLWYSDAQKKVVEEARSIIGAPRKRKDEVKEFAKIFWVVFLGVCVFLSLIYIAIKFS